MMLDICVYLGFNLLKFLKKYAAFVASALSLKDRCIQLEACP